jgi:sodium-independent sulfate anion transporter 11
MSTITGNVVAAAAISNPDIPGHVIASALAILTGTVICFIGLIRCGWIVDFIPLAAIAAFMTGSALNIAAGQVPTMLGQSGFSTRDSTYIVIIHTLQYLPQCKIDAAMGLTALLLLYAIRSAAKYGARRYPSREKIFFYIQTLRTVFVILLYTLISWLVNRNHKSKPTFKILSTIPRGKIIPMLDSYLFIDY